MHAPFQHQKGSHRCGRPPHCHPAPAHPVSSHGDQQGRSRGDPMPNGPHVAHRQKPARARRRAPLQPPRALHQRWRRNQPLGLKRQNGSQMAKVERLKLGLDADFRDTGGHSTDYRPGADIDPVTKPRVEAAAIQATYTRRQVDQRRAPGLTQARRHCGIKRRLTAARGVSGSRTSRCTMAAPPPGQSHFIVTDARPARAGGVS
jgi:hypothetical protein